MPLLVAYPVICAKWLKAVRPSDWVMERQSDGAWLITKFREFNLAESITCRPRGRGLSEHGDRYRRAKQALLFWRFDAVLNRLRTIGNSKTCWHDKQRSLGLGARNVSQLKRLLAHARVCAPAIDHRS
jgi:hypothetical protein